MFTTEARTQVDRLIDEVVEELEGYEKEMSDYEMRQRFEQPEEKEQTPEEGEVPPVPAGEEEDDIERLKRLTAEKEQDYASMSPKEINDLIDQALDEGDFERVKMLSGYLPKESAEIWLREVHRINEMRNHRK